MITGLFQNLPPEAFDYFTRLLVAGLLGALLGLERDIHGRAAGLRTHLLVSLGAAAFMIMSEIVASSGHQLTIVGTRVSDPGRIAAQIVSGIGFLGAGAILKEGFTITGLTTASCLWVAAGIGMASGAEQYIVAFLITFLALAGLVVFKFLDRLLPNNAYRSLTLVTDIETDPSQIIDLIKNNNIKIVYFDQHRNYVEKTTTLRFAIKIFHKGKADKFCHSVVQTVERAGVPLKSLRWDHRD